jgi:hypothetical protein
MMSPRLLLGVAVRVLGLWFLTDAAYSAFWAALKYETHAGIADITPSEHAAFAVFYLFLAAFLLCFADPITWFIYGLPPKTKSSDAADSVGPEAT